ncbi:MAG: hemolysin III family protein [Sphaerochaetaceae bacterium]|jgi:hemolysin III|nr:hemolysin III family protein [Sphaerochaetaceae bacterium]NLO61753.1 DNA-binding protein [Spirochaetales bacterium]MDD2405445.1 hemolysin III family protein [Sphaerochaetaceae bacterium]MDD3671394.1 hemolysin III family protein [Sphaerochaetaceae bacterium]MDD4259367.1 hemolysin III family protein [Sphaerochaetaceae bacterium]
MNTPNRFSAWLDSHIDLHGNESLREEKANMLTHMIGLLCALAYLIWIIVAENERENVSGLIIHACSLILLYGCSATYHNAPDTSFKRFFRLMDHSTIYVLIAGTYTPVLLYAKLNWFVLVVWLIACVGIFLSIIFWGRYKVIHVISYLAMGWMIVPVWNLVVPNIPRPLLIYIIAAGLTYSLGVLFYIKKTKKYSHTIWHIFCLAAGLLFSIGFSIHLS